MNMRIPPLNSKILHEANPLKSRISVQRLAVSKAPSGSLFLTRPTARFIRFLRPVQILSVHGTEKQKDVLTNIIVVCLFDRTEKQVSRFWGSSNSWRGKSTPHNTISACVKSSGIRIRSFWIGHTGLEAVHPSGDAPKI